MGGLMMTVADVPRDLRNPRAPLPRPMMGDRSGVVTVTMAYAFPFMILLAVILFKMSSLLLAVTYMSPFTERLAREHGSADDIQAFTGAFNASPMTFWCEGEGIDVSKREVDLDAVTRFELIDTRCQFNLLPSFMGDAAVLDLDATQLWRRVQP